VSSHVDGASTAITLSHCKIGIASHIAARVSIVVYAHLRDTSGTQSGRLWREAQGRQSSRHVLPD
jgi:hypothetical protein